MAEINEVIDKVDEVRKYKKEKPLVPFDVTSLEYPPEEWLNDKKNRDRLLKEFNHDLPPTPVWLDVYFVIKSKNRDPYYRLVTMIDEVKYGDQFLKENIIKRFSALPQGALYDRKIGRWRVLCKNEAKDLIEHHATSDLTSWGVYDDATVTKIQKYITRSSYDYTLSDKNPFEEINPQLALFKSGTYNFKTNAMQPNNPDDYILNYHDYEVDPANNKAPETDKLLNKMIGDADTFFKEYIGYCFYRSYEPFQTILFLHGTGGNGKSTLLNHILGKVLGKKNYSAVTPQELANDRFKVVQLYGKEINSVADIKGGYLSDTAVLKKVSSGGDPIEAEYKGLQGFQFVNYAKLVFSANDLPTFSDDTEGLADRLKVINFINGNTRKNRGWWSQFDMDLISDETPAFAMECIQLFKKALDRQEWSLTDAVQVASDEWLDSNNHFKEFVDEVLIIDLTSDKGEKAVDVVRSYKLFCDRNGYKCSTSGSVVKTSLEKYGVQRKHTTASPNTSDKTNTSRYIGVTFNPHNTDYLPQNS